MSYVFRVNTLSMNVFSYLCMNLNMVTKKLMTHSLSLTSPHTCLGYNSSDTSFPCERLNMSALIDYNDIFCWQPPRTMVSIFVPTTSIGRFLFYLLDML
jgi:hypothetical protein